MFKPGTRPSLVVSQEPAAEASTSSLALMAMKSFRPFLQDISIMYRVLETLLNYLDKEAKWEEAGAVQGLLGLIMLASGDQTFPLFSSLIRHSSTPGLSIRQRIIIIQEAVSRVGGHIDSF